MQPRLELISQSLTHPDLPETWRVLEAERFSAQKTLYDYQTDALWNAACALFYYYGDTHDWVAGEPTDGNQSRKQHFASLYETLPADLKQYEKLADSRNDKQNSVFKILSDYIDPSGGVIKYHNFINRMCFWMATGSGKTLVMVKLIEYLHVLIKHGEIPPHKILILAPSDHLIEQIRKTVDEFNANGLFINLVPLRDSNREYQSRLGLGNEVTVYYHRSDNISDVQKDALTDYRTYENGGKWYVLLDEAHKGGKEDSKRQAYYKVMSREGFLFNFSATFTDDEDIVTTVKKYNLADFIKNGHGKNIYLNTGEYDAFKNREEEISHEERRKIVLKSLITLAHVSMCVGKLRENTSLENLYHLPLMLTLVNSVNTDVKNEKNDLWAFFQILREIATGEIEESLFSKSCGELADDWQNARFLFGDDGDGSIGLDTTSIKKMQVADLRSAVFLSRRKGGLQFIRSGDNKELAFQMKNADSPFALIRIGNTAKWRNKLLVGYEETTALQEKSFFNNLERSPITILMGSRSFFESWDSNRPNVINFINIGTMNAKKFVVQSVGRGVRIETLPGKRRRLAQLFPALQAPEQTALGVCRGRVGPPETLFLFATNRAAVKSVLDGLAGEKVADLQTLEGLERSPLSKIGDKDMPLLVPKYKEKKQDAHSQATFALSEETLKRLKRWFSETSDSVFAVRDGLAASEIAALRGMVEQPDRIKIELGKNYAMLAFLQNRLVSHLSKKEKVSDGVREMDDDNDIVHFLQIRVEAEYAKKLQEEIRQVKRGSVSDERISVLADKLKNKEITRQKFDECSQGKNEADIKGMKIKKLLGHYYFPVVLGNEKTDYMQHIIKVQSEVEFLNALGKWIGENTVEWDAWMFSKIDESLDDIHIPYYDTDKNDYRRFLPDFVFWMCRGNEYRIVFVDPKGTEYASAYRKIDGYKKLFKESGSPRIFQYKNKNLQVQVDLLMFNDLGMAAAEYRGYWTDQPERIFQAS